MANLIAVQVAPSDDIHEELLPTFLGFLDQFAGNPDDDTIRLVFADWVEEATSHATYWSRVAELIRLQIEQSRAKLSNTAAFKLGIRIGQLAALVVPPSMWIDGPEPSRPPVCRGLINWARMPSLTVLPEWSSAVEAYWYTGAGFRLNPCHREPTEDVLLNGFVKHPLAARLGGLDLSQVPRTYEGDGARDRRAVREFVRAAPVIPRLRGLSGTLYLLEDSFLTAALARGMKPLYLSQCVIRKDDWLHPGLARLEGVEQCEPLGRAMGAVNDSRTFSSQELLPLFRESYVPVQTRHQLLRGLLYQGAFSGFVRGDWMKRGDLYDRVLSTPGTDSPRYLKHRKARSSPPKNMDLLLTEQKVFSALFPSLKVE